MRTILAALILGFSQAHADNFAQAIPMPSADIAEDTTVSRIALGSCFHPSQDGAIFDEITAAKPDLFLFIGDNVYAQDESPDPALKSLRQAYARLAAVESFSNLRRQIPVLTVWDDHDYGLNEAGGDWPGKHFSESLYEYAWAIDEEDARVSRPGVYFERVLGRDGRTLQLIFLDTRFFRTPLTINTEPSGGRYLQSQDENQSFLGTTQWLWLEQRLDRPADLTIIITSNQLIADGHGWEAWRTMPKERERLYRLIEDRDNIIVVSGDRHAAAIYERDGLLEMTASSLNRPLTSFVPNPGIEPGPYRIGDPYFLANYGLIDIDWDAGSVSLNIMDGNSETVQTATAHFR